MTPPVPLHKRALSLWSSQPKGTGREEGVIPTTLDGMCLEELTKMSSSLKDESFKFKPCKRLQIPKAKGGTRPLTIAPPSPGVRDNIVQEATFTGKNKKGAYSIRV